MEASKENLKVAQEKSVQSAAIDEILAGAIEDARPLAELDSRVTTLSLLAFTLIGVCTVDPKPTDVEVLGFTIEAVNWMWLVATLILMLCYMVVHVSMMWWSEYELWKLRGFARVCEARDRLRSMLNDASELRMDDAVSAMAQDMRLDKLLPETFEYPHDNWTPATMEIVEKWMDERIERERTLLMASGYFNVYSQADWQKRVELCKQVEQERALLLPDRFTNDEVDVSLRKLYEKKASVLKEMGPIQILNLRKMDPKTAAVVTQYAETALRKLLVILRMARGRIVLMLVIPTILSIAALWVAANAISRNVLDGPTSVHNAN